MRSFSDVIANSRPKGDRKPAGPITCAVFVAVLMASATGAAYWIGSSLSQQVQAQPVVAMAGFGF